MKTSFTTNEEILSLVKLLEDKDSEIVQIVTNKLISIGTEALGSLENSLLSSDNTETSERILFVCGEIQKNSLVQGFENSLIKLEEDDLLMGAFWISTLVNEDLEFKEFEKPILEIQKILWLESSPDLNDFKKSFLLCQILYEYFHFEYSDFSYQCTQNFIVWELLKNRQGNALSLSILFLILANYLDIPIIPSTIPNHILLTMVNPSVLTPEFFMENKKATEKDLLFFVDPSVGMILHLKQVKKFASDHQLVSNPERPIVNIITHKQLLKHYLQEIKKSLIQTNLLHKATIAESYIKILEKS